TSQYSHLYQSAYLHALHSFPTRRSSDLPATSTFRNSCWRARPYRTGRIWTPSPTPSPASSTTWNVSPKTTRPRVTSFSMWPRRRSEEHTSELQSRENLVCRLLLEKKNQV